MKSYNCLFLAILFISITSYPTRAQKQQQANSNETNTISITAQQRPFDEAKEFDMHVMKALETLDFANPSEVAIDDQDLVMGILINDAQIAIPLSYLSAFEIANFSVDSKRLTLTWCPIVGSARVFEGEVNGDATVFDFGRGLNNNNLLVVDRKTSTVWNQLSGKAIHGKLQGEKLNSLPTIQSTWGFWKQKYPNTKLLINKNTTNPIFPNSLNESPHYYAWKPGDGRPNFTDEHHIETLGLGIEMDSFSVYFPLNNLFDKESPITYEIGNQKMLIHFDKEGLTAWAENVDGNMISSIITYSWAWKSFYPDTKVFQ